MSTQREIKFRAWHNVEKRWIEPEWVDVRASGTIVRHYVHRGYNIGEDKNPGYLEISQYTGLRDKNGKEIYEGDICRIYEGDSWTAEVSFVGAGFCFVNRNCCTVCAEGRGCIGAIDEIGSPVEVIGNIYESPGLLGETPENQELLAGGNT